MEKSISNAFTFMFKDSDWLYKLGILIMLYAIPGVCFVLSMPDINTLKTSLEGITGLAALQPLLSLFIPSLVLSIILYPFIFGYFAKCTHNVIKNNWGDPLALPNWEDDFFSYFLIGIKRCIAMIIIGVVLSFSGFLLFIPALIFGLITVALDKVFCTNFDISAYFKWGKAFKIVSSDTKLYFNVLIVLFLVGLLMGFVQYIPSVLKLPNLLVVFLSAISSVYFYLVFAYLTGIVGQELEDSEASFEAA